MPKKPKRPCSYQGCPALTDDRYCPEHKKLTDRQYEKYQRDPNARKRYGTTWRRIRDIYIAKHPLCEQCSDNNKVTAAQEVHHIFPLARGGTHDESNLMSLCKSCHSAISSKNGERWRNNEIQRAIMDRVV